MISIPRRTNDSIALLGSTACWEDESLFVSLKLSVVAGAIDYCLVAVIVT